MIFSMTGKQISGTKKTTGYLNHRLKFILCISLPMLLFGVVFSQTATDTIYTYYDWQGKQTTKSNSFYISALWPENSKWHRQEYHYPSMKLKMNGWYADKEGKIRDGLFIWYEFNGTMIDSCLYVEGKMEGIEIQWNRDGYQTSVQKWKNGLPVDTAYWYSVPDGKINAYRITDETGNGIYRWMLPEGRGIRVEGNYVAGKKSGKWTYRDANGVVGTEAMFSNDSIINIRCFDEKGLPESGQNDCEIERQANFIGGIGAWRLYLEKNLRYPPKAVKNEVQGTVRLQFNVDKEGNVSDVKALDLPDTDLANEAVRIIEKSGRWEPAKQYNRKVINRHIQSITFRLE